MNTERVNLRTHAYQQDLTKNAVAELPNECFGKCNITLKGPLCTDIDRRASYEVHVDIPEEKCLDISGKNIERVVVGGYADKNIKATIYTPNFLYHIRTDKIQDN